jgi:hypothetical protein
VQITVRNFSHEPQPHEVRLALPPGIKALPPVIKGTVPAKGRQTFPVQLTVEDRSKTVPGVQIVPMDVALGERHFGQWFDFLLMTQKPTP